MTSLRMRMGWAAQTSGSPLLVCKDPHCLCADVTHNRIITSSFHTFIPGVYAPSVAGGKPAGQCQMCSVWQELRQREATAGLALSLVQSHREWDWLWSCCCQISSAHIGFFKKSKMLIVHFIRAMIIEQECSCLPQTVQTLMNNNWSSSMVKQTQWRHVSHASA